MASHARDAEDSGDARDARDAGQGRQGRRGRRGRQGRRAVSCGPPRRNSGKKYIVSLRFNFCVNGKCGLSKCRHCGSVDFYDQAT